MNVPPDPRDRAPLKRLLGQRVRPIEMVPPDPRDRAPLKRQSSGRDDFDVIPQDTLEPPALLYAKIGHGSAADWVEAIFFKSVEGHAVGC